jgi:ligand-binding SRPBCC domain-containing protein
MTLEIIHRCQRLPIPLQTAWDFFSDPCNLRDITPPELGFQVTSEPAKKMHPGMIITYNITPLFGISHRWITEITHAVEPHLFVDEQRFGPYRFWHHQHLFREIAGGIEMEDVVHYIIPFGRLGYFVAATRVKKELQKIFDFRCEVLAKKFGML